MGGLFFGANWKENKTNNEAADFLHKLRAASLPNADIVVFPSFVSLITAFDILKQSRLQLGCQDISMYPGGAYTGEVSVGMVRDFCSHVIVGHSERRTLFGETDAVVSQKLGLVLESGLTAVLCIGENKRERSAGRTAPVLFSQLKCLGRLDANSLGRVVIAYEPLWAISHGRLSHEAAKPGQIGEAHGLIRGYLRSIAPEAAARVIYGGSVHPSNAKSLAAVENVDGFLIGSASLEVDAFCSIISQSCSVI